MICQLLCESKTRPQLLHRPGKAQERDRTADLVLTKDVLYRLSYLGILVDDLSILLIAPFEPSVATCFPPSAARKMERETGLEPATPSLEGLRSTN